MSGITERSLATLELPAVRALLAERSSFIPGRELAEAIVPTSDLREAERLQDETAAARALLRAQPSAGIGGARDIRDALKAPAVEELGVHATGHVDYDPASRIPAPTAPAVPPAPPAPTVEVPPPPPLAVAGAVSVSTASSGTAPTTSGSAPGVSVSDLPGVMKVYTALVAAGRIQPTALADAVKKVGLPTVPALGARPDLCAEVARLLNEAATP